MAYERLADAVATLHAPTSSASTRAQANAWLVAFSHDAVAAPPVCVAALRSDAADANVQTFAAGIIAGLLLQQVTTAAEVEELLSMPRLLELCLPPACGQAVGSLACAIAAKTSAARAEEGLLGSAGFAALAPSRQAIVLQALAEALAQQASAEELRARPSVVAACAAAVRGLQSALVGEQQQQQQQQQLGGGDEAIEPLSALACLASWASCGVLDFTSLTESFPSLATSLIEALDPQAILSDSSGHRLACAARSAAVLRACLQGSLDADEGVELDACESVLAVLAKWLPAGGVVSIRSLGAPTVDVATGMSDGGGAHAEACNELASNLAGVAALLLELLAEEMDELAAAGAGAGADAGSSAATAWPLLQGAIQMLVSCSDHPLSAPAEVAAEGWLCLLAALPPTNTPAWRTELFGLVAQLATRRASRAHLRCGTGEDLEDLMQWRERCAAPLLAACSEALSFAEWWTPTLQTLRSAADPDAVEAALFCGACTSPRCSAPATVEGQQQQHALDEAVRQMGAQVATRADPMACAIAEQAEACLAALHSSTSMA